ADFFYGGAGVDSMFGGDGNDRFFVSSSGDFHDGGEGHDTMDFSTASSALFLRLFADSGVANGSAAGDTFANIEEFIGTNYADDITGSAGGETIRGGNGNDKIAGFSGDDIIYGNDRRDALNGDDGNDTIYGGGGGDQIRDDTGDDYYVGGTGRDSITFRFGNDQAYGGNGRDKFDILGGSQTIEGGDARDRFVFNTVDYDTTVTDYTTGEDRYWFYGDLFDDFADFASHTTQVGSDVVIEKNDAKVTLTNTDLLDLSGGDFVFYDY
ncbi:MAG: calcium-binding protein, partial [Pseudomonadota bacterium]